MSRRSRFTWLPRLLWGLTLAAATALFLLVLVPPLLDNGWGRTEGGSRLLTLFARDATLRRTALASALGLIVTACVFFRPLSPAGSRPNEPRRPPSDVVGA